MSRIGTVVLGCVLATAPLVSTLGDEPKSDVDRLQGTWEMVSLVRDGKAAGDDWVKGRVLVIAGATFVDRVGEKVYGQGTVAVDPKASPKVIDATFTEGPPKGQTSRGIFTLEGDNTLKACASEPGLERPKAFASEPGTGQWLVTYKRATPR